MAATHLLDSDVCIDLLAKNAQRGDLPNLLRDGRIAISVITYGEVYDGVLGSRDLARDLGKWQSFVAPLDVVEVTPEIAEIWAGERRALRLKGLTIPDNDILIAATAVRFDLTLVTRNFPHFGRIERVVMASPD